MTELNQLTLLPMLCYSCRVLTRNFGKITFLRHLGKLVRQKTYPHTVRHVEHSWGSGSFFSVFFVLKRSLLMLFLGPFSCAKTMHKLLSYFEIANMSQTQKLLMWDKIWNKNVSWTDCEICFSWENVIWHLWGLGKPMSWVRCTGTAIVAP